VRTASTITGWGISVLPLVAATVPVVRSV